MVDRRMPYDRSKRKPVRRVYSQRQEETDEQEASPQYAGHYAGLHPEDTPRVTTADVRQKLAPRKAYQAPDETEAGFSIARMSTRYNGTPMPDGTLYRQGNEQVYVHTSPPPSTPSPMPQRASRARNTTPAQHEMPQLPQHAQSIQQKRRERRRLHWLFIVGATMLVMLGAWVGLSALGNWWQIHSDDGTYGRPRTYQTDAVVGHQDSQANPSHFIALNLRRHISITEYPGGRIDKAVIYSGPVLFGQGGDLTPATLSFKDENGDGRVDMILHILDQQIVYLNNGTRFVPPPSVAQTGG